MAVVGDVYPSRTDAHPRLIARVDPIAYQTSSQAQGPLSSEQLASYVRNGFLVVEGLLDRREVSDLDEALLAWTASPGMQALDETIAEPDNREVRSIFRVHELHPEFGRLARDERLAGAARQILGSAVYMHQSRVNLKPGFTGKEFYWHSDFETWHAEDGMPRMRALSVSLALTTNYAVNGPLMLVPGSHEVYVACVGETPPEHYKASLRRQEYGVPDRASLQWLVERGGIVAPTGPPGTAVFFDCNTMHGSSSNITPYPRRNVFLVYNSVENHLQAPFCGLPPRPEHIASRTRVAPLAEVVRP